MRLAISKLSLWLGLLLLLISGFGLASEQEELQKLVDSLQKKADALDSSTDLDGAKSNQKYQLEQAIEQLKEAVKLAKTEPKPGSREYEELLAYKRMALSELLEAVMKCLDPPPEWITLAKSLEKTKSLGPGGVDRLKQLMELAVKSKATSKTYPGDKWVQEAILRIIRAFNSVLSTVQISTPDQEIESAFSSAVMAAVNCLDVADLLLALIEYMAGDKEEGIPALSAEGRKKLTALLIELYALKQKPGVELEEIHRKGQEIRSLLWKEREQATTERRKKKGLPPVEDFLVQADFSSLEGQITLAEEFREGLNGLECYDFEGKPLCTACSLLDIKSESGFFTFTLAQEPAIGKLSFPCHGGRLELTRVATGAVASELGLIRGWAHVYGGNFLGTIRLPEGTPWQVGEGTVRIGEQEARLIGARQGELLVSASDLPLPLDGTLPVEVEGPGGLVLAAEVPAWSYEISCARVTTPGYSVPIRAFLYGLPPSALVTIRFFPREGQRITPLEVQLPASQLLTGLEVALFTTSKLGEQHFGVAVGFELPGSELF